MHSSSFNNLCLYLLICTVSITSSKASKVETALGSLKYAPTNQTNYNSACSNYSITSISSSSCLNPNVTKATVGQSCINVPCSDGLVCENNFHRFHGRSRNYTCSVPWTSEHVKMARNFTDSFIESFKEQLESNITYNIHSLGYPLINGTKAEGVLPTSEEESKAGLNDHLNIEFGNHIMAEFPIIAKESTRYLLNKFMKTTPKGLTESQLNTAKEKLSIDLLDSAHKLMSYYVESSWEIYKKDTVANFEELRVETLEDAGASSLVKRRCNKRFCRRMRKVFTKIKDGIVKVFNGIVTLVQDGLEVILDVFEGVAEFAQAIVDGDVSGAFSALGKGFVSAFNFAVENVKKIGKGIWKGVTVIKDGLVKFGKWLASIKPSTWISLLISIVIGVALSVIFPPLAAGYFGAQVGTWTATAIMLTTEIVLGVAQGFLLDPIIKDALLDSNLDENLGHTDDPALTEKPPCVTSEETGLKLCIDEDRDEYCFTSDEGVYLCHNVELDDMCVISDTAPDVCIDDMLRNYIMQNGTKSYFMELTGHWVPPLNTININGNDYTYDEKRREHCYIEENLKYCRNAELGVDCIVERENGVDLCADIKGWFTVQNGVKLYNVDTLEDGWAPAVSDPDGWVPEEDLVQI